MAMRVGVAEKYFEECSDPGKSIDKVRSSSILLLNVLFQLAIDYIPIPQPLSSSITKFSSQFFQSQNRRRHAIRVYYQ